MQPRATVSDNRGVSAVIQIRIVEDFDPFRQFICSKLREKPELQVVGEVSDGMEGVRKAEELQPDLILLDVGLPTLDGIEAARRIYRLSRKCKIVFVSQESSADVVQEAFRSGASGYVVKAAPELTCSLLLRQFLKAGILSAADYGVTIPPQ